MTVFLEVIPTMDLVQLLLQVLHVKLVLALFADQMGLVHAAFFVGFVQVLDSGADKFFYLLLTKS